MRNAATYTPATGDITIGVRPGDAGTVDRRRGGHGARHPSGGAGPGLRLRLPRRAGDAVAAPGLGAGLWVCRELAARNGGSLTLASEPGAGVRATLVLPAAGSD